MSLLQNSQLSIIIRRISKNKEPFQTTFLSWFPHSFSFNEPSTTVHSSFDTSSALPSYQFNFSSSTPISTWHLNPLQLPSHEIESNDNQWILNPPQIAISLLQLQLFPRSHQSPFVSSFPFLWTPSQIFWLAICFVEQFAPPFPIVSPFFLSSPLSHQLHVVVASFQAVFLDEK